MPSCQKQTDLWVRTKSDELAVEQGCYFDERAAERVRTFFSKFLRHSKGEWAGKPFELLPWQWDDLIAPLFGWKNKDGKRRFREAFVGIPKKNGKSTIGAGIGLYLLCGDNEQGAEVYSAASDRDQASIVHGEAIRMVESSEALSSYLTINRSTKNILFGKTQSVYRALSGEAQSKEGLNASGIIVDELHVWHGDATWNALKYAGRSRRQPLRFTITTAGEDKQTICGREWDYALGVQRGEIEDTRYFSYVRQAETSDDWKDPATWQKANPSLGSTFTVEDFAADVRKAEVSPTEQASFQRYSLNIWTTSTQRWLRVEDWKRCKQDYTAEDLAGESCFGGLDLAKTQDMTALVLVFPHEEGYRILPYFWLPESAVTNPNSPAQYRVWAQQGLIEVTPGDVCDYRFIKRRIGEIADKFYLNEFAYDPYNAEQITQEITEEFGIPRILFPQTISNFAEPTAEFERQVIGGTLQHNGHAILDWQASHCTVKTDANNNRRPVKPPGGDHRKIDGMVAAIMGLSRAMRAQVSAPTISFI